ncbi:alpha/beta fold hydrolase, partial [Micromonospora humida]|uniref:alpha/beta fold hydrolase n=1 Tax=Micromonospora humida TaxID=2809018 RepID=UPI0036729176
FALLGHDAGATVAQAYAATHPERLTRLVLVCPGSRLQGELPDVGSARQWRRGSSGTGQRAEVVARTQGRASRSTRDNAE